MGVDHRHCPNCGRPQDPKRRYFPDEKDAVPAPEWLASHGPDHYCPYCQTANSSEANFCAGCGGPMDGSREVGFRDTNHGEAAETVQDAVAEARREAQERRSELVAYHTSGFPKSSERRSHERYTRPRVERKRHVNDIRRGPSDPYGSTPVVMAEEPDDEKLEPTWADRWDQYKKPGVIAGIGLLILMLVWAIFFWEKTITTEVKISVGS